MKTVVEEAAGAEAVAVNTAIYKYKVYTLYFSSQTLALMLCLVAIR